MNTTVLAFLLVLFSVTQTTELIPWSTSRKLTWADFKGTPDPHSSNAALTSSNINVAFGYNEAGFQYSIRCTFDKNRSWVRIRNNDVLIHEQGHFDIAELYARKLNKALKEYRFNAATANNDLNKLYEGLMKEHRLLQTQYDQGTDYSRSKPRQEEWLKRIAADLKSLEAYANYQSKK